MEELKKHIIESISTSGPIYFYGCSLQESISKVMAPARLISLLTVTLYLGFTLNLKVYDFSFMNDMNRTLSFI